MSIGFASDLLLTKKLVFAASVVSLLLLVGTGNAARAATIVVPAGGNLQAALNAAQCGDTVVLEAGATFTVAGLEQPFQLKPKGACTGTDADWITVKGSNADSLPATLRPLSVQQIRALNFPKLVTNTSTPALEAVASAHHYRLIGIEITNDSQGGTLSNNGLIFAGIIHGSSPALTFATVPRSIEFDRVWVHSEEDGTDSEIATCLRGFLLGAADITIKNSRVAGFRAFAPGTFNPQSSQAILIEKGPGPYTISNNFLEAWFTSIFTGGGPQWVTNQAAVSSGATLSQATLSNVNNLAVGDYIAFKVTGQGGVYQVVRVTGINGNTVNYVPQPGLGGGTNGNPLLVAPDSPGHAVWNGDTPKNLRITNNTFWKNSVVGLAAGAHGFYGKGHIEFKTATDTLVEGNDFSGFGAGFTITSRNQPNEATSGSNPWATINNLTFRSNRWSSSSPSGTGAVIGIQLSDNMATCVPGRNVVFENNLFENLGSPLLVLGGSAGVVFRHNTAVGGSTAGDVSMVYGFAEANEGFRFEDNIVQNNEYGLNCSLGSTAACYPNYVVTRNVLLDNRSQAQKDFQGPLPNIYPAGNFSANTISDIQFIDWLSSQWGLAPSSPYKGRGLNGTDPGVDMAALLAALSGVSAPPPTPTPTPGPSPSATPTPNPTPTATPTPSPGPSGSVVWVEDALPAGATGHTQFETAWNWVSSSPAPFSGVQGHQSESVSGTHQHYFDGATDRLTIGTGDSVIVYVFLDATAMPDQIMLQWKAGDWNHRAYWGANSINWGTDGTDSRRFMGPLPAAGQWVRLEVPARQVGLEGQTIDGMAFALFGGRATWDRAGKTSQATQLGETILMAKRDGQNLANQVASSGGGGSFGSSNALEANSAEQVALDLFIVEIQQAYAQFTANSGIFPASIRINIELAGALQRALLANSSFAQNDIAGFRNHLRLAIGHLELSGVLIAYPYVANPIDVASYVVRQHYVDFFDREPEQSGNDFWVNQFSACGTDAQCFADRRIHVSAAFFLSIEFQQTGYFVHRLYKSSYGRVPSVLEFMPDNATIGQGVVVGTVGWEARLAANKDQFLQSWVQRADFSARYASLTNEQYVDALIANLEVTIGATERDALILDLASGWTRANILGRLAQNEDFSRNEFNRAFVLMQYFGYLRRDPDSAGFNFWLNKLNQFNGNYQSAEMVKAFLISQEYRSRFSL